MYPKNLMQCGFTKNDRLIYHICVLQAPMTNIIKMEVIGIEIYRITHSGHSLPLYPNPCDTILASTEDLIKFILQHTTEPYTFIP